MEEQLTAQQVKTIRDYLEGMLAMLREDFERREKLILGKLGWLNSIDQGSLFLVDSAGVVTMQDHRAP